MLGVLCGSLTGCGTTLGSNVKEYFNQVGIVLGYYMEDSSGESGSVDDGTALDAPADVMLTEVEEDEQTEQTEQMGPMGPGMQSGGWDYSFSGVENASYYQIEVYSAEDENGDAYASETVQDDGSDTYTGTLSGLSLGVRQLCGEGICDPGYR